MNNLVFFTATILEWKPLLTLDKYKNIIISSLKYLVENNKIKIYAFVIMPNHIHLIWKIKNELNYSDIQRDFLKYTSQMIKFDLEKTNVDLLNEFYVDAKDRKYQIWERNPLSIELISKEITEQKINYIHKNPLMPKWNLAEESHLYKYASTKYYLEGTDEFGILENYMNYDGCW
ncbi:MAG TPA: transposase [Ignavibacteria bacterium]|nr:transposase [Ignavibacteria bacterium]